MKEVMHFSYYLPSNLFSRNILVSTTIDIGDVVCCGVVMGLQSEDGAEQVNGDGGRVGVQMRICIK
jgi:hypothetical protein